MVKYLIVLLLVSCGQSGHDTRTDRIISLSIADVEIDEELKQPVKEFIGDMALYGRDFKITFKSIKFVKEFDKNNVVGRCYYDDRIEILEGMQYDETYLKLIVYHELGHCLLKFGHTPENSNTIMQPTLIGDNDYIERNWNSMVKYLITQQTNLNLDNTAKVFQD